MRRALRPLSLVLAVLLVFAGGLLDLCACDASSHGALCAQAGATGVATCHDAPAPEPAHGCCAEVVIEAPSCCAETSLEPSETITAAGCSCPVIVLERSPSESPASSAPHLDRSSELGAMPSPALLTAWLPPASEEVRAAPWPSGPPGPKLRRHLELHVLRF